MDLTLLTAGIDASPAASGAAQFNAQLDLMADRAEGATGKINSSLGTVSRSLIDLRTLFAGGIMGGFVNELIHARTEMQRVQAVLTATTGSTEAAMRKLDMVRGIANRVGVSFETLADQYRMMAEAQKTSALTMNQTDRMFSQLSTGARGLGMNTERTSTLFSIYTRIMSRGYATTVDFTRQLNSVVPGAFQRARQALGLTNAEFNQKLTKKQIKAEDILPAFADSLATAYQPSADKMAKQTEAIISRLKNSWFDFRAYLADNGLGDVIDKSVKDIQSVLDSDSFRKAAVNIGTTLAGGIKIAAGAFQFLMVHAQGVFNIMLAYGGLKTFLFFTELASRVNTAKTAMMSFAAVQRGGEILNTVMSLGGGGGASPRAASMIGRAQEGGVLTAAEQAAMGFFANKAGKPLTASQMGMRRAGSAWGNLTAEQRVLAFQYGRAAGVKTATPSIADSMAYMGSNISSAIAGNSLVQGAKNAWANAAPPSVGRGSTAGSIASKLGLDPKNVAADLEGLNFTLDKNGKLLTEAALKARVAGAGYGALSGEAKSVVSAIAQGAGMEAGVLTLDKFGSKALQLGTLFRNFGTAIKEALGTAAVTAMEAVSGAWASFVALVLANPVGITLAAISAAIVGVGAALYALRNHTLTIGNSTAKIGSYVGVIWEAVTSKIKDMWTSVWSHIQSIFGAVTKYWDGLSNSALWKKLESFMGKSSMLQTLAGAAQSYEQRNNAVPGVKAYPVPGMDPNGNKPGDNSGGEFTNVVPKRDALKEYLDEQRLAIAQYQQILGQPELLTKYKTHELEAVYQALKKIVELKASPTANKGAIDRATPSILANAARIANSQYQVQQRTAADEFTKDLDEKSKFYSEQKTYLDGLMRQGTATEEVTYLLKAYDQVQAKNIDLTTAQGQSALGAAYAQLKLKGSIEDSQSAYAAYNAKMSEYVQLQADAKQTYADILANPAASGKTGYQTFEQQAPLLLDKAGKWADLQISRDKRNLLTPEQVQTNRKTGIETYMMQEKNTYTQGLIDFAAQVKQSQGAVTQLINEKGKLDDAFRHKFIDQVEYDRAIKQLQQTWDGFVDRQLETDNTWQNGFILAMREISRTSSETAKQFGQAFTNVFQTAQNALVEFLDTGKFNFKGFGQQLRHELDTILVQRYSGTLMQKLLGNMGNTYGQQSGIGQPTNKGTGFLDLLKHGGSTPVNAPRGTSGDPLYVALTTGSDSNLLGLPQKLGGAAPNADGSSATAASASGAPSKSIVSSIGDLVSKSKAADGTVSKLSSLGNLAGKIATNYGFAGVASASSGQGGVGIATSFLEGFMGQYMKTMAQSSYISSLANLGAAIPTIGSDTSGLFIDSVASPSMFATGGIMTPEGKVPLHRGDNDGGVATSPQAAVFGEGKSAEAYVPLPDGRSIPVNMKNGGGSSQPHNVTLQHETRIIDQTGRGVQQQSSMDMDGAKYVQTIVLKDLMEEGPMAKGFRSYFGGQ